MSVVLDITRSISRAGGGPDTGIDRVERAYLNYVLAKFPDALYLAKTGRTFAVLNAVGVTAFLKAEAKSLWPRARGTDVLRRKLSPLQRRVRTFLRQNALSSGSLEKVAANFEGYKTYINVGHTNLSEKVFQTLKAADVQSNLVMVHDMIPLDFPEYTRADTIENFTSRMKAVSQYAGTVICNSKYTEGRVNHWFTKFGRTPETLVAYLGIEPQFLKSKAKQKTNGRPSFAIVGTIEPRKNHMVLLDVWNQLAQDLPPEEMPKLDIIGKRGWNNEDVFAFLDSSKLIGKHIFEHGEISDTDLMPMLENATALLFPSFVEGYGLPALEAAAKKKPVICSDIPVFKELLGNYPEYASATNADEWKKIILKALKSNDKMNILDIEERGVVPIHTWQQHFATVFRGNKDVQT